MKMIISACLLGLSLGAAAQNDDMKKEKWQKKFKPMMTRGIGASFQKFDGLNSRVRPLSQYKGLPDAAGYLSLGWMNEHMGFISMGNVYGASSMSGHRDEKSSALRYLGIDFNLGYNVLKNSNTAMLYPFAGVGLQGYQAIFWRDNSNVPFDDVLASPTLQNNISSVRFTNGFVVYRGGIGVALRSPKHPANTIGIQAAYTGSFTHRTWKSKEGQSLSGSPRDNVSQFTVGLVLSSGMMGMH